MTRVLITGAQGLAGRYLVAQWLANEPNAELVGIGRSAWFSDCFTHQVTWGQKQIPAPLPEVLRRALTSDRYRYVSLDLHTRQELVSLLREIRPAVIVHLAASLRDDPSEQLFKTNALGTESLFEAIASASIAPPRVVLGSSGSVYGAVAASELPINEDAPCSPIDMYSISKRASEDVARVLALRHGIPMLCARIFNIVGPGQDERHLCGWLASQLAPIARGVRRPEIEVGPLNTTRDFIDVRDVANALYLLSNTGTDGETYNVASGLETPVQHVYDELLRISGLDGVVNVVRRSARPSDMPRNYADISKLRKLGFSLSCSLERSLKDVYEYYLKTAANAAAESAGKTS